MITKREFILRGSYFCGKYKPTYITRKDSEYTFPIYLESQSFIIKLCYDPYQLFKVNNKYVLKWMR